MTFRDVPNPFTPGIGRPPPVMGHRPEIERPLLDILHTLSRRLPDIRVAYLYGPRGNGKTVQLNWLLDKARQTDGLVVLRLAPGDLETPATLAAAIGNARGWRAIARNLVSRIGGRVGWDGAEFSIGGPRDAERENAGGAMDRIDSPLLITLDEAHTVPPGVLKELLDTVQHAGSTSPVGMVLAGTPGLEDALIASGASYWSRGERLRVGRLPAPEAERVIAEPLQAGGVSVEEGIVSQLTAAADRYPFFLQVCGAAAWDSAGTGRLGEVELSAALGLAGTRRREYYSARRREFRDAGALALAREVALACGANAGRLTDVELDSVLGRVDIHGWSLPDKENFLRQRGYLWQQAPDAPWEPGIPSLMDYMVSQPAPTAEPEA